MSIRVRVVIEGHDYRTEGTPSNVEHEASWEVHSVRDHTSYCAGAQTMFLKIEKAINEITRNYERNGL